MCLIVFAYRQHPEYPLILVANRDEFYDRAAEPMHYWNDTPEVLAGRDSTRGGTWLGLTRTGRFCAVTNFRDGNTTAKSDLKSRGSLVHQALTTPMTLQQHLISSLQKRAEYGGFNLISADQSDIYYSSSHSAQPVTLSPGYYALSNAHLNSPWPKSLLAKRQLKQKIDRNDLSPTSLIEVLANPECFADHLLPNTGINLPWERALSAQFIRLEDYGTRAKTILVQKKCGTTHVFEQRFDRLGLAGESDFQFEGQLLCHP